MVRFWIGLAKSCTNTAYSARPPHKTDKMAAIAESFPLYSDENPRISWTRSGK